MSSPGSLISQCIVLKSTTRWSNTYKHCLYVFFSLLPPSGYQFLTWVPWGPRGLVGGFRSETSADYCSYTEIGLLAKSDYILLDVSFIHQRFPGCTTGRFLYPQPSKQCPLASLHCMLLYFCGVINRICVCKKANCSLSGPPFFVPDEQVHSLFGEYYQKITYA